MGTAGAQPQPDAPSSLEDIFARLIKHEQGCVCPFSSYGLTKLKDDLPARAVVEEMCGGVPDQMPKSCSGKACKDRLALRDHAKRNMATPVDEYGDEEDDEGKAKMHRLLHSWLDGSVSNKLKIEKLQSQLAGQNAANKQRERDKERKASVELSRGDKERQQLRQDLSKEQAERGQLQA